MEELKISRARAVDRLKWILENETYCSDKLSHAAINMALGALRRAAPENKPLTLEQLRQMDGEPVWIVMIGEAKPPICEIVVESYKDGLKMANVEGPDDYGAFDLYGKTWLAYARKPEGSEP